MINLLGLDREQLTALVADLGEKPFRAKQILRWVHRFLVSDIASMDDLSKPFREKLAKAAQIQPPTVLRDSTASDGTRKWLLDIGTNNAVEMVFIPEEKRGTLCISSQAGCALDCGFCSTGKQGFNRNLTTAEIIGQLWLANLCLRECDRHTITNVVMMGMGEPLANLHQVIPALRLMLDDGAYGLSRRRVTVSTAGLVPGIDRLREACPVALAVSLHAATDELRTRLMPINAKYPLGELFSACQRYLQSAPRDFITFEYVMLDGVNDRLSDARRLIDLVAEIPCKINLIPFNPFPGSTFARSSRPQILAFQRVLMDAGVVTTVRKTRGDDIDAACGQLAGQVQDKTNRVMRIQMKSVLEKAA